LLQLDLSLRLPRAQHRFDNSACEMADSLQAKLDNLDLVPELTALAVE